MLNIGRLPLLFTIFVANASLPFNIANATSLGEALAKAYNYNPQLKAERANVQAADEAVSQASAEWLPTLTATAETGIERAQRDNVTVTDSESTAYRLDYQQPIFQGGGSMARYRLAKNSVKAARAGLNNVEQQVLLQTVNAYMNVVSQQTILELNQHNEAVLEKHLNATQERFKLGEVTKTDVSQAKARLARAQTDKLQAEGELVTATTIYERIIGEVPVDIQVPTELPEISEDLDDLIETAFSYNPILKRAEFNEMAAKDNIHSRKADLLPSVNLLADIGKEDGTFVSGSQELETSSLTLNVNIPLYQSGTEYSRVREAKKSHKKRHFDTIEIRNELKEAVIQSYQNLQVARATIISNESNVEAASVALEGVEQEAIVGSRTTLDVLDAEQELFEAKVDLVNAQREEVVSTYQLLSQIGVLNAKRLDLDVEYYDPRENYSKVKHKAFGF